MYTRAGYILPHHNIPPPPRINHSPPHLEPSEKRLKQEKERVIEEPTESLQELGSRLLYHSVKWARSVPAFIELAFTDQIRLLEESWCEIFILFAFQWNLAINATEALQRIISRLSDERVEKLSSELKTLEDVALRFRNLNVSEDEFIYLKSVVLFKPGKLGN